MDRREFLKKSGAVAAGGALANLGILERAASAGAKIDQRPNIVFILVDEMRFPSVFPAGVSSPEQFLRRFMPNVHQLWTAGVKFESYYSSGNACSPARATIATGLYPHQQWLLATRTSTGPALQAGFPTYGKLLRTFGYRTPYIGKWHLSNPPANHRIDGYLENYGFQGYTNPDPTGTNGQGFYKDGHIANQAVRWLERYRGDGPFCLTVSFVNPHDKQFFWAGTEGDFYEQLFAGNALQPFATGYQSVPFENNPARLGYPAVPPNWESLDDLTNHNKPDSQQVIRSFQEAVWGGAPDDRTSGKFTVTASPLEPESLGVATAPFHYWRRGLDMYTQVLTMVDRHIGTVVSAIPKPQLGNTVFVFASDHGEYAGAHGLLSGKLGTAYEEAIHIPLIVTDPSGRFTRAVDKPRQQLVSSVDLVPLLVTLGNRGSSSWRTGENGRIYSERLNVVDILRSPRAPGRDHVLFATDEILPSAMNYLRAPTHVLAVRTQQAKLVTYTEWAPLTTRRIPTSLKLEFYDYSTAAGRAETESRPNDPRAKAMATKLFNQYVPQQMEAPLPLRLHSTVRKAHASYVIFRALTNAYTYSQLVPQQKLATVLGYSENF